MERSIIFGGGAGVVMYFAYDYLGELDQIGAGDDATITLQIALAVVAFVGTYLAVAAVSDDNDAIPGMGDT